jgi:translation initiation factor IF-1
MFMRKMSSNSKGKIPVQTFDELYNILYGILLGNRIFKFKYFDEIVEVEFRHDDKMFYVEVVRCLDGRKDYGYLSNKMELYNWMLRPDPQQCIVEIEKTIIELT